MLQNFLPYFWNIVIHFVPLDLSFLLLSPLKQHKMKNGKTTYQCFHFSYSKDKANFVVFLKSVIAFKLEIILKLYNKIGLDYLYMKQPEGGITFFSIQTSYGINT